jgi:hypothetical protein
MHRARRSTCSGTMSSTAASSRTRVGITSPLRASRSAAVRSVSQHAPLEHGHRDGPDALPVPVPRRHQDRRVPDGTPPQGTSAPTRQPLHR